MYNLVTFRYVDVITHHMPLLDAMQTASRKAFQRNDTLDRLE